MDEIRVSRDEFDDKVMQFYREGLAIRGTIADPNDPEVLIVKVSRRTEIRAS